MNQLKKNLANYPKLNKFLGTSYQRILYYISPRFKYEGDIQKVTPDDEYEYFFGYYDKSPWNYDENYMVCLRTKSTLISPAPDYSADIMLIDVSDNSIVKINETKAWNTQQGCMLQWNTVKSNDCILFNDFRENRFCSVSYNIKTKEEIIYDFPIYDITSDGQIGLGLDFSRLHLLRPGYGYSNVLKEEKFEKIPNSPAIWSFDFITQTKKGLITYKELSEFKQRPEMLDAMHGVNHIMINPSGDRAMFIHRWIKGNKRYSRLITMNIDGSEMFILSDDDMVSHCCWKDNETILSYCNKDSFGEGYYLMKDRSGRFERIMNELNVDGHPTYSPDGKMIITDQYPNRNRIQSLYLYKNDKVKTIAKVFSPFKYNDDLRCDLHPRWDRNNRNVCFDATFEGKRGLYIINVEKE